MNHNFSLEISKWEESYGSTWGSVPSIVKGGGMPSHSLFLLPDSWNAHVMTGAGQPSWATKQEPSWRMEKSGSLSIEEPWPTKSSTREANFILLKPLFYWVSQ